MNASWTRDDRWLLPEGVEELLPPQAEHMERLRRRLLDLLHTWGYQLVIPPLIEYVESLLVGTGRDLDLQTFKLTDQLTGRLLGVRADMTPQVARIDAHRLQREVPTRLCYLGPVLRTRPDGFGRSRSPLQMGAELYGHGGIESDVEVIELMASALCAAGMPQVHIDFGHVGIFRGLAQRAELSTEQEAFLFDALQRKAAPEIVEFFSGSSLSEEQCRMFVDLVDLNGGEEVLVEASERLRPGGDAVLAALDNLRQIAAAANVRLPGTPFHYDLAELRGYRYQTGVVFAAFVPGYGQEIARGGRYDDVGRAFGRARPATGFSMDLKTLVALDRERAEPPSAILAQYSDDPELRALVQALRQQGERVVYAYAGHVGDTRAMGCDRIIVRTGERWEVKPSAID